MYRLGHHIKRHYWPLFILTAGILLIGAVLVGAAVVRHMLKPNTVLQQSSPVVHHFGEAQGTMQHIVKPDFSIDLPDSWIEIPPPKTATTGYSWRGAVKQEAAQGLDIYIDHLPQTLAVNRLLPVQSTGLGINILGDISENCANFTDKTAQSAATGTAPAKWDGVSFICDMGNYERDVAATGSGEGINSVTVTGPKTGSHHVLLVFMNNNISPDFTIFTAAVRSFQAN